MHLEAESTKNVKYVLKMPIMGWTFFRHFTCISFNSCNNSFDRNYYYYYIIITNTQMRKLMFRGFK